MNPITPAPVTQNAAGIASLAPNATPVAPTLPTAPTPVATPAPVQSPAFDTQGTMNAIANYYKIPQQTAAIVGAGQAQGQVAQQQFEAQKYNRQIDIENAKNQLDPTKYNITKNSDGSLNIMNSQGQKVDLGTYASLTSQDPLQVLQQNKAFDQESTNFIQNATNLQDFIQTKIGAQNGDIQAQAKLGDFYKATPGLQNIELGQLKTAFMQQYGKYYGQPFNDNGYGGELSGLLGGKLLASQNNPSTQSPYQNPNYAANFQTNQFQPQGQGYGISGNGNSSVISQLSQLQSQLNPGQ